MSAVWCDRCVELLDTYHGSTRHLTALSKRLADAAIGKEVDIFIHIMDQVVEAQQQCVTPREAILLHLKTHSSLEHDRSGQT